MHLGVGAISQVDDERLQSSGIKAPPLVAAQVTFLNEEVL